VASAELIARARAWMAQDPDPDTRAEIGALCDAGSDELDARFRGPLEFGTAGLRAIVGGGESMMNRAVVRRTSAGLARYLLDNEPDATKRGVVVGHDARRMSNAFAVDTAMVLTAAGIPVHLADGVCPTPLVAYGVRQLDAVAGVMVTASHNPPAYNGYKVYARNGAQIVPPADCYIAQAIELAGAANAIATLPLDEAQARGLLTRFGAELERRYLDAIEALPRAGRTGRGLGIVYTPLHGVGGALAKTALADAGFTDVSVVPEQAEPDGTFPTVSFPNPEEPGALDLALALARQRDAALVLANDPDADRLAAAVRIAPGRYRQLTGNELGTILGHALLEQGSGEGRLVITTIVSSPLLGVMARAFGAAYAETLTGFKWIANKAMDLEAKQGMRFVFGYEEALGYTVGDVVRDKDGIGSALVLAAIAADLHAASRTLCDELERIYRRFGVFASGQRTLPFGGADGPARMQALVDRLRADPPATLAGAAVTAVVDCIEGVRRENGVTTPIDLPKSNVLVLELDGGHRVIARPSGTEPKVKIYFDVREPLAAGEAVEAAEKRASARIAALATDVMALVA
jgi:phosphomannomutase